MSSMAKFGESKILGNMPNVADRARKETMMRMEAMRRTRGKGGALSDMEMNRMRRVK